MSESDFKIVSSKIDDEKDYFNYVSQEIWKNPELKFEEKLAHNLLTDALLKQGFEVHKNYFLPTAFRAEFSRDEGASVAILLEYDALPEIGHACGHNLIAEAGLAAAFGVKAAMENDSSIIGKLIVLGTPAEEGGGGKIKLMKFGALDGVDAALMVHPASRTRLYPKLLCCLKGFVDFRGKEAHAGVFPWDGINALDAAVCCYNSISMLRQQMKPDCRINVIIAKGGSAVNVIPSDSSMAFMLRAPTAGQLKSLCLKVKACIDSSAEATGCEVKVSFPEENIYENLITNKILMDSFKSYLDRLGVDYLGVPDSCGGSTDMGNVSHRMPAIHPMFAINSTSSNHTKGFATDSGDSAAQDPTLAMAKALALTALHLMRCPETLEAARKQFQLDMLEEENI